MGCREGTATSLETKTAYPAKPRRRDREPDSPDASRMAPALFRKEEIFRLEMSIGIMSLDQTVATGGGSQVGLGWFLFQVIDTTDAMESMGAMQHNK